MAFTASSGQWYVNMATPESRLAVLLERCELVKNELTALNEERVGWG